MGLDQEQCRLTGLYTSARNELSNVWKEVGVSEEDVDEEIEGMLGDISAYLASKVRSAKQTRNRIAQLVADSADQHVEMQKRLGDGVTASRPEGLDAASSLFQRLAMWKQHSSDLQERLEQQTAKVTALLRRTFERCQALGRATPDTVGGDTVPVSANIDDLVAAAAAQGDVSTRRQKALSKELDRLDREFGDQTQVSIAAVRDVLSTATELGVSVDELEQTAKEQAGTSVKHGNGLLQAVSNGETVLVRPAFVEHATRLRDRLHEQLQRNQALRSRLLEEIETRWQLVDVSQEEREAFVGACAGLSESVIKRLSDERDNLNMRAHARVAGRVAEAVESLHEMWSTLSFTEGQKEDELAGLGVEGDAAAMPISDALAMLDRVQAQVAVTRDVLQAVEKVNETKQKLDDITQNSTLDRAALLCGKVPGGALLIEKEERQIKKLKGGVDEALIQLHHTVARYDEGAVTAFRWPQHDHLLDEAKAALTPRKVTTSPGACAHAPSSFHPASFRSVESRIHTRAHQNHTQRARKGGMTDRGGSASTISSKPSTASSTRSTVSSSSASSSSSRTPLKRNRHKGAPLGSSRLGNH